MFVKEMVIAISIILFIGLNNPVHAQDFPTAVRSIGAQDCGNVIDILTKNKEKGVAAALYVQWLSGFVSSYNIDHKIIDVFPIRSPGDELLRFFAALCGVNMDVKFVNVVVGGLRALEPYKISKPDKLIAIEVDGNKYQFYQKYIKASQAFLRDAGQNVIPDGLFGPKSEAEFRKFKSENNLSGPPIPDFTFLLRMVEKSTQ